MKQYVGIMQAVLPLRGKILNIERKDEAAMYKNEEIQNLILGLGLGVKVSLSQILFMFLSLCCSLSNSQVISLPFAFC